MNSQLPANAAVLKRLLAIVRRLQAETDGFQSNPHDQQA